MCYLFSFHVSSKPRNKWGAERPGDFDRPYALRKKRGERERERERERVHLLRGVLSGGFDCDHLEGTLLQAPKRGNDRREPLWGWPSGRKPQTPSKQASKYICCLSWSYCTNPASLVMSCPAEPSSVKYRRRELDTRWTAGAHSRAGHRGDRPVSFSPSREREREREGRGQPPSLTLSKERAFIRFTFCLWLLRYSGGSCMQVFGLPKRSCMHV